MLGVASGAGPCCPMPCKGEEREPRDVAGRGLPPGTRAGQRRPEGRREGPNLVPYPVFKK